MRRKGTVGDGPQSPSTPRPGEARVSTVLKCCGYSLLLRQRLIASLEKGRQSDCEEEAGAGYVTFTLDSA